MTTAASPHDEREDNDNDVLVHLILTGASGYLGQHLLAHWIQNGAVLPKVKITALYNTAKGFPDAVQRFCDEHNKSDTDVTVQSVDLTTPKDIKSFAHSLTALQQQQQQHTTSIVTVVVHTAALSSPRLCEEDPLRAQSINVPVQFFDAIFETVAKTAVVALSTDQVYDGTKIYYKENAERNPANVYGKTKLKLEDLLVEAQSSSRAVCCALRSSIILGPPAPIEPNCAHGTFLEFCKSRGHQQQETTFFTNEYRCVVRVDRVLETIQKQIQLLAHRVLTEDLSKPVVHNMGGPVRVNRMDMARAVFDRFGYDHKLLLEAEQTSPTSPLDISMDSSLLDGILAGVDNHNNTTGIAMKEEEQQPGSEVYLKELVDYVFGSES